MSVASKYKSAVLALSPAVALSFNATSGTNQSDETANGNNGTYSGTYTLNQSGPAHDGSMPSVLLDGSSGEVTLAASSSLNITGNISIEIWVYCTSYPASNNQLYEIVTGQFNGSNQVPYYLDFSNVGGTVSLRYGWFLNSDQNVTTTTLPPLNQWSHVIGTWNGSTFYLYINNVQVATAANTTAPHSYSGASVGIGYCPGLGRNFPGKIATANIYPSGLTASQVSTLYNAVVNGSMFF